MKSIIFFTTQTSATASMWRIFTALVGNRMKCKHIVHEFYLANRLSDLMSEIIPTDDSLIQFNVPSMLNPGIRLNDYRFIINFRDPRDMLCNAFSWAQVHPDPSLSEEAIAQRANLLREEGIDKWVIRAANPKYFENVIKILENTSQDQRIVLSYARLCLDFDSFLQKAAQFLGVELTDSLLAQLEVERTENLSKNPHWIGNQWMGSDVLPGRYKSELKSETIEYLSELFGRVRYFV